jgi:rare lipoprotein A (peptidoglycan hydrolase)
MITRATRALPGMVVSMLLAAPALAAAPSGQSSGTGSPLHTPSAKRHAPADHRKSSLQARHPAPRATRHASAATRHSVSFTATSADGDDSDTALGPVWTGGADSTWHQTGIASWYGGTRWQSHTTSSGDRYDQNELTAAHATLPIGTRVRVTLEGSDRSIIVVINDRPGTHRRIIDLSRGAAKDLGMLNSGVAVVTLSLL